LHVSVTAAAATTTDDDDDDNSDYNNIIIQIFSLARKITPKYPLQLRGGSRMADCSSHV
jgi:hypothetical protein